MSRGLAELLERDGAVPADLLRAARAAAEQRSVPLERALVDLGADEAVVWRALARTSRLPFVDLAGRRPSERLTSLLAAEAAWEMSAIPVATKGEAVVVAVASPEKAVLADTLQFLLDRPVTLALAAPTPLREALHAAYGPPPEERAVEEDGAAEGAEEAPIVRLVQRTFQEAVEARASDVHVEPFQDRVRIRMRVDGALRVAAEHPPEVFPPLMSHLKVTAGLDIAEKRRPQDGRIGLRVADRDLDVRVSVLPTQHGETCVMRLLDREANLLSLEDLGMPEEGLRWFEEVIERPSGLFLVTGPTGSGKTTTLYAALQTLNRPDKKILTVEDPVEYRIRGINQVQVRPQIGLTFARALRAFLRQAPNVVLVGEIRDRETAEVAIQASLTGHIVFSTVHTNDAPSAVTRLLDMGVPPFLIATSLQGVLAQRLVRRLCPECSYDDEPRPLERRVLELEPGAVVRRSRGCRVCGNTGVLGRTGVYEWLDLDEELREELFRSADGSSFVRAAEVSERWRPLRLDALDKARKGVTSVEEVLRVTRIRAEEDEDESAPATAEATPEGGAGPEETKT